MSEIATKSEMTREQAKAAIDNPIKSFLPPELRAATWKFAKSFKYLWADEFSIAVLVGDWLVDHPHLRPEDVAACYRRLSRPERIADYHRASDLMAALGAEVRQAADRRQQQADVEDMRQRAQPAANPPTPEQLAEIRRMVAGMTSTISAEEHHEEAGR